MHFLKVESISNKCDGTFFELFESLKHFPQKQTLRQNLGAVSFFEK